jgi:hypothetical protein
MNTLCCHEHGCDAVFHGVYSKGNLGRHRRLKHEEGGPKKYACEDPLCPRVFDRKDARLKHRRRHHLHLYTHPAVRRAPRLLENDGMIRSPMASPEQQSLQDS